MFHTDTHFATAGDWSGGANSNDVSGYAMNFMSETVCTDCHNPHKNADINRDWAQSLHADKAALDAWAHYNWTCDAAANCDSMGAFGDRTSCQRCHTTTGFAAYADALGNGNTSLAADIFAGSKPQLAYNANFNPEMLDLAAMLITGESEDRGLQSIIKIPVGGFLLFPAKCRCILQYPLSSNVCCPATRGAGAQSDS
jgi:hypothetical protein